MAVYRCGTTNDTSTWPSCTGTRTWTAPIHRVLRSPMMACRSPPGEVNPTLYHWSGSCDLPELWICSCYNNLLMVLQLTVLGDDTVKIWDLRQMKQAVAVADDLFNRFPMYVSVVIITISPPPSLRPLSPVPLSGLSRRPLSFSYSYSAAYLSVSPPLSHPPSISHFAPLCPPFSLSSFLSPPSLSLLFLFYIPVVCL